MGIAYRCDKPTRCTFIVWHGDVTPDEWSEQLDRIMKDPEFPPGPLLLADLSSTGGAPSITVEIVKEMARRWADLGSELANMQWAIVPNGACEKARQFEEELKVTGVRTLLFNSTSTACTWLGLDQGAAAAIIKELREELRA